MARKIAIGAGAVLGVVVLVIGIGIGALFFVDWNAFRERIGGQASEATGRTVEIRGDLDVALSWRPQVRASDFIISNPDWASDKEMAHVGEVYFQFRVWPLLMGRIELDSMRLTEVAIHLEKSKDGQVNWNFGRPTPEAAAVKVATPQSRGEFPVLRKLMIEDAELTYRVAGDKPIALHIDSLEQTGGGLQDPVTLKMRGTYQGSKYALEAELGSFGLLRDGGEPYPAKIKYSLGEAAGTFEGTIREPLDAKGVNAKVTLKGRNLEDLHRLLGLPLAQSPPYEISGQLSDDKDTYHFKNFAGRLGTSDLRGDISVTLAGERPKLSARVTSNALAMTDIEGFWGAKAEQPGTGSQAPNAAGAAAQAQRDAPAGRPPQQAPSAQNQQRRQQQARQQQQRAPQGQQQETQRRPELALSPPNAPQAQSAEVAAAGGLIPDEPFRLDKLRAMDVDLDFQAKSIKLSGPALDNLKVKLLLENGKVTLKPLELGIYNGKIAGNLVLDGSGKTPELGAELDIRSIKLSTILATAGLDDKSVGELFGRASLRTRGNSLHQLAGNANGNGLLEMEGGQISALLLELMALDLPDAIGEWIGGSKEIAEIACLLAPFEVRDGTLSADPWLFDTSRALVVVKGYIDLKHEKTELSLTPHPKDFSFFNTLTSIEVEGDLARRKASVDVLDAAAKVVLKALLAPFQPLVSPPQEERAREARPCAKMLEQAQALAR